MPEDALIFKLKSVSLLSLVLLSPGFQQPAFAQSVACTNTLNQTQVLASFLDNTIGAITPRNVRDYVCSMINGSIPFTNTVTITGPNITNNEGISITTTGQTTSQTVSNAHFPWNSITDTNDNINNTPTNFHSSALEITHDVAANSGGSKYGISVTEIQQATATNPDGDHIGGSFISLGQAPAGAVGGSIGSLYGLQGFANPQISGSTGWFIVSGAEFDSGGVTGTSYQNRFGIDVISSSSGNIQGSVRDAAIELGSAGGSFNVGIMLSTLHGSAPISTTGTIIGSDGSAQTVANGIDFSSLTITGSAFKSSGFSVNGSGVISTTNSTASSSTSTGALIVTGGAGIGGALNVGGAGNVTGNLTTNGTLAAAPTSGTATAQITAPSAQKSVLSFIQSATTEWQLAMQTSGTEMILSDVPNSISAIDVNGGTTKTVTIGYTTASGNYVQGALIVSGGEGVAGDLNVNGHVFSNTSMAINPAAANAAMNFNAPTSHQGGFNLAYNGTTFWQFIMQVGGNPLLFFDVTNGLTAFQLDESAQQITVGYTTATSSTGTGSLIVSGGMGISGGIFAGGSIRSNTGFNANGSSGLTQTCTVNQAKTLIFTLGILTGGSCNT